MSDPGSQPPAEQASASPPVSQPPQAAAQPADGGTLDYLPLDESRDVDIESVRRRLWMAGAIWSTAAVIVGMVLLQRAQDPVLPGPEVRVAWLLLMAPGAALLLLWLGRPSRWGRYWLQKPQHTLYLGHPAWPTAVFWAAVLLGLLGLLQLGWGMSQAWHVSLQHAVRASEVFERVAWPAARVIAPLLLAMFVMRWSGERAERSPVTLLLSAGALAALLPALAQLGAVLAARSREVEWYGEASAGRLAFSLLIEVAPMLLVGLGLVLLAVLSARASGWRISVMAGPLAIAGIAVLMLLGLMRGAGAGAVALSETLALTMMQAAALVPLIGLRIPARPRGAPPE